MTRAPQNRLQGLLGGMPQTAPILRSPFGLWCSTSHDQEPETGLHFEPRSCPGGQSGHGQHRRTRGARHGRHVNGTDDRRDRAGGAASGQASGQGSGDRLPADQPSAMFLRVSSTCSRSRPARGVASAMALAAVARPSGRSPTSRSISPRECRHARDQGVVRTSPPARASSTAAGTARTRHGRTATLRSACCPGGRRGRRSGRRS
jgi:hypothetical protein